MSITKSALILALLALLVMPSLAQMGQQDMDQQALNATVQPGPRLRTGLPFSADVFVNGVFAMRVPASAGGLTPMQRAERIAERLNQAFAAGLTWQDTIVMQRNGLWTVNIGDNLIATADVNSARAFNTQTGELASRWARQSVVAMGGQPQLIAQQLLPIAVGVAGEQVELGPNWQITPTRSVPLVNVADGQQIGSIMVAGAQNNLNNANAVALYAYSADGANVWQFVPTTSANITGVTVPRAAGVGVVRLSADVLPMANIAMGDEAMQAINQMTPAQWNAMINNRAAGWRVQQAASTKVVPLYSMSTNQIMGAAQVVGNANAVAQTQAVTVSEIDGMLAFSATATPATQITGQPAAQNNVVVSALITFPGDTTVISPVSLMK